MKLQLCHDAVLTREAPGRRFKPGGLAKLVDRLNARGGSRRHPIERFNAFGETMAVIIALESALEPLPQDQIPRAHFWPVLDSIQ